MNKISTVLIKRLFSFLGNKNELVNKEETTVHIDSLSFEQQMNVFYELGYKLNYNITNDDILQSTREVFDFDGDKRKLFEENPFSLLYYHLGYNKNFPRRYFTNDCIWYDLEFIDPSSEYIEFMKRMGEITNGEISFTDINLRVDENNYEWIDFNVNGNPKSWKLAKVNYIDDSFFQRFSYLPTELKVNGRYTYFDDGGQQFVIDYATEEEQKTFIERTGLKREWLGECNNFSEHDPNK